jgi:UDP-3-O-[3-hydroxymyristoyl] glucosamine N-acyltransferase
MQFTAGQIAGFFNGTIEGDEEITVSGLSKIEEGAPGTITFLSNPKYSPFLYTTGASIVVINHDFIPVKPVKPTLIRVADAYTAFATLLEMFDKSRHDLRGISAQAWVDPTATIGENSYLGEFAWIGRNTVIGKNAEIHPQVYIADHVTIGDNCTIFPGVKIYHDCVVGNDCTFHAGVVIGSDGFGFAPQNDKDFRKIPQIGNVVIEDKVEIGSNTTIDRATLGSTILRRGVKLDNLIQVAHNVEIGENTVIAAQTGISGSTKIGRNCMIAGQVGIVGHLVIEDNVKIGAQSGIEHNIKEGAFYLGTPAQDGGKARRLYVHWRNFDQLVKKIYSLEKLLQK